MGVFDTTDTRHYKKLAKGLLAIEDNFANIFRFLHGITHGYSSLNVAAPYEGYVYVYGAVLVNKILLDNNLKREQLTMISALAKAHGKTADALYPIINRDPEEWRRNSLSAINEALRGDKSPYINMYINRYKPMLVQCFDRVEALVNEWCKSEGLPRIIFQETLF